MKKKAIHLLKYNFSSEELLIVYGCRYILCENSLNIIEKLINNGTLDWEFIASKVTKHGIGGIMHAALSSCRNFERVPQIILNKFKLMARRNIITNLLFLREFEEILKNCNRENIKIMPLKGIAFLKTLYHGNLSLREMYDIDILIDKKDRTCCEKILLSMGYEKKVLKMPNTRSHFHDTFVRQLNNFTIPVEIHWDIDFQDSPFDINIDDFWERSCLLYYNDVTYYNISIEDNIILNCLHILRDDPYRLIDFTFPLKNFCDVAKIIIKHNPNINWEDLVQRSKRYRVIRPVALVLLLVRELFEIMSIPDAIMNVLYNEDFQDDFAISLVKQHLFTPREIEQEIMFFLWIDIKSRKTLSEKIKVLLGIPRVIADHFKVFYHCNYNTNILRTAAFLIYYFFKRFMLVLFKWFGNPYRAYQIKKKMAQSLLKTRQLQAWIRG